MTPAIGSHDAYQQTQALGGNIDGEEIVVTYEKTTGGEKTVGGEVVNAHENYDNRNDERKVLIDFESYAGNWRLEAINGEYTTEVTLYSLTYEYENSEKVGVEKTRISTHDGVREVMNAEDW